MPGKKPGSKKSIPAAKSRTHPSKSKAPRSSLSSRLRMEALPAIENSFEQALQSVHIGIWDLNLKSNRVKWSKNAALIFGVEPKALGNTLDSFLLLVQEADRKNLLKTIDNAIQSGEKFVTSYRVVRPDGEVRWIEGVGKIILNKKGTPVKMMGSIQDITAIQLGIMEKEDWKIRYELITASAGLIVYDYDIPSGNIIWSGLVNEVLGYTPQEMGDINTWAELIHPQDRDNAFRELELAEKELRAYQVSYRFLKKSGQYIHLHDKGFFLTNEKGQAYRMLGTMQDISDRIIAENTIAQNARFKESIENAMPGMLYVYDLVEDRSIYANRNARTLLGYTPEEIGNLGSDFTRTVTHPDDLHSYQQWTTEPDGVVKETQYRMKTKSGQWRWFISRDTVFRRDENGFVTQIIGIAQDITERKQSEELLRQREKSYHELFDSVSEAIFILNLDGTFADVNNGACEMYGLEKSDFIGRTTEFLSAPDKGNGPWIDDHFSNTAPGVQQSFEWWGKKRNGEIFLKELRLSKGSYFGKEIIIATGRDVTRQRESMLALQESEQRFRTLQQASFGGIGLHDQGIIIDCNQGLADITGYSYKELVGKNGLALIAPEWQTFVLDKIRSNYEQPYDVEGIRKDGSRFFLEIHGKQIPYLGRNIRVTEFRDITERKRAEEKILEQNTRLLAITEELKRNNEQLEEFTQIVSHNLRAPVGNILTLLNFLEAAETGEERTEYLNYLKESGNLILRTLHELNDVLKIKQSKNIEKQHIQFESVFNHVKSMLVAKITEAQADVKGDFAQAPDLWYPNIYMESIFLNLMSNALKYVHPERKPVIRFKTYLDEGHTMMKVTDNGLGIDLGRYGHQIFRLRKTFHRHPESRGIGLFMIKNQIEAVGGEISISSVENEGTTFFINFNKHHKDGQ
jgi:PAS domain S-box-containing protein